MAFAEFKALNYSHLDEIKRRWVVQLISQIFNGI